MRRENSLLKSTDHTFNLSVCNLIENPTALGLREWPRQGGEVAIGQGRGRLPER